MVSPDLQPWADRERDLEAAFIAGNRVFYLRRAEQLEAARPRRSDYRNPELDLADVQRRYRDLTEAALACRRRAEDPELARMTYRHTLISLAADPAFAEQRLVAALAADDAAAITRWGSVLDDLDPHWRGSAA